MFFFALGTVSAQEGQEYLAELGFHGGGLIYAGEVNNIANKALFVKNLNNIQPDLGLFGRYKFNTRLALRIGYDYSAVAGNYASVINNVSQNAALNNKGISLIDVWGEYNFFDYEYNKNKRYSKTYSPYLFLGLGYALMPNSVVDKKNAFNIPLGLGMKVRLGTRWNLNMQWVNRLFLRDNVEGMPEFDNPLPATKANILNNDFMSGLTIGLSYNFWEKSCNCNSSKYNAPKRNLFAKPLNNSRPRKK